MEKVFDYAVIVGTRVIHTGDDLAKAKEFAGKEVPNHNEPVVVVGFIGQTWMKPTLTWEE